MGIVDCLYHHWKNGDYSGENQVMSEDYLDKNCIKSKVNVTQFYNFFFVLHFGGANDPWLDEVGKLNKLDNNGVISLLPIKISKSSSKCSCEGNMSVTNRSKSFIKPTKKSSIGCSRRWRSWIFNEIFWKVIQYKRSEITWKFENIGGF